MFLVNGPRSISMYDLSKKLSISKKTIYKYFDDKEDLVTQVVKYHIKQDIDKHENVFSNEENPIKQLIKIIDISHKHLKGMSQCFVFDVQKYYPNVFDIIKKFKETYIKESLIKNIEKGKKDGYYLKETNDKKTLHFHMLLLEAVFGKEEHAYPNKKEEIIYLIMWYLLRAISTDKGLKYIKTQTEFKNNVFKD